MGIYPQSLEKLIEQLSRLPGIGQKSATRVALFILRSDRELAETLAKCLVDVKEKIKFCSVCFNLTDDDLCPICRNDNRADGTICVVEGTGDQLALEEAGIFKGRYHVLQGALSPLDGIGPEDLRISELLKRLDSEKISELIIATNPTTEGEATASFLFKIINEKNPALKISRIALGIPMGGDLKYTDRMTIEHALKSRVQITE
ncbi:gap repair protein [uncultured Desulfobacterium sp.]|uniref:Recombination protein RecR n=1 Tax=uncultured Desulfobacterium sp. TaxID=201089 RepID=A0A445N2Z8_9BACT|nr:gap repair protein [uncultured Desulfobacterium sp.]